MTTSPVRLLVVGLGAIAVDQYLPQIAQMADAKVVAVCDVRPEWARRQADRFGIEHVFTDVDEMLASVEADALVDLASIPAHFEVNLKALRHGLHLYSQKPFASTVEEATILIDEAARHGLHISASPIHMLRPEIREVCLGANRSVLGHNHGDFRIRKLIGPGFNIRQFGIQA